MLGSQQVVICLGDLILKYVCISNLTSDMPENLLRTLFKGVDWIKRRAFEEGHLRVTEFRVM
jgi:hypothetical protein